MSPDIVGQRFGRLVPRRMVVPVGGHVRWACTCDCGREKAVAASHLQSGATRSCGCLQREAARRANTTHGDSAYGRLTAEYRAWTAMKTRCTNPKIARYGDYGGRGIKVCQRWTESFESFLADMGRRPSPRHSLDRINPDGDYAPDNCRWATSREQAMNQRRTPAQRSAHGRDAALRRWHGSNGPTSPANAGLLGAASEPRIG